MDDGEEYANRVTLGGLIGSGDWLAVNALITQRVLHDWPILNWMRMREPDGSVTPRREQELRLDRARRTRDRIIREHRREQPDCLLCRAEDVN